MLRSAKTILASVIAAGATIGGMQSASAALQEGDAAVMVGGSYIYMNETSYKFRPDGQAEYNTKVKLKKDKDPFTASLDFLIMATDDIAVNVGTSWPATVKRKLKDPVDGNAGKSQYKIMPFHVLGQYYFLPPQEELRPYVGFGLHYTHFSDFKSGSEKWDKVEFDKSYGVVGKLGLVFNIDEESFIDASASWYYLEPDGKVKLKDPGGSATGDIKGKLKDAKMNPWIFNVSFGFKI
ncbi:OmpW/AlkL family protein [Parendozoicomonas haliclonae]|uniref:Outer membrane protein W n=1 Tax=Parendozoicomonas haliclonae TaxID=1960125 RepID=A0A1X7AKX3_9GAMM|nr:OmpW family outer membrane protein [Parendozoicomonas haliclonae]SMA48443.1 Outer membrane protein W precursor [Parendozoicomonas haliclonae]